MSALAMGPTLYGAECPQLQFGFHFGLKTPKIDYTATFT